MQTLKQNQVGFSVPFVVSQKEDQFINAQLKAGIYKDFPEKERIEMLKNIHKRALEMDASRTKEKKS